MSAALYPLHKILRRNPEHFSGTTVWAAHTLNGIVNDSRKDHKNWCRASMIIDFSTGACAEDILNN